MANVIWIEKTEIADGKGGRKVVHPGDLVEIIPVESRTYKTENDKNLHGELLDLMQKVIGRKVPIKAIGQFPNGETSLYFRIPNGEVNYAVDDFQAV
jgi:hypothetical protein